MRQIEIVSFLMFVEMFCLRYTYIYLFFIDHEYQVPLISSFGIAIAYAQTVSNVSPTVDGFISNSGSTYSTVHDATNGSAAYSDLAGGDNFGLQNELQSGTYYINREVFTFDSSFLTNTDISAVSLFMTSKYVGSGGYATVVSYANEDITTSGFDNFGSTSYGSVAINTISVDTEKEWVFNSTGISAIVKNGITKLGVRIQSDIDNTPATDNTQFLSTYYSENDGHEPYLKVTYASSTTSTSTATTTITNMEETNKALGTIVIELGILIFFVWYAFIHHIYKEVYNKKAI